MEQKTLADTIREITRDHLTRNNGLLLGQAVSAVGWINNTVPECEGIVELPMTDVAGAGIAVGAALVGRRPIFVIRFQDLLILNGSPLIFYAAKTKELHGRPAPIFVRALATDGVGPVHSGVLHSVFMHFPGFMVCSPMTPGEYEEAWKTFMDNDDPMMVSEHRVSFSNCLELEDTVFPDAHITLYAISSTRFAAVEAVNRLGREGIRCNLIHIMWLKPFEATSRLVGPLCQTGLGLVIDSGHEIAGASQSIAFELNQATTGACVRALGLHDRTKCLCAPLQNTSPDAQRIYHSVKAMMEGVAIQQGEKGVICEKSRCPSPSL
jgi:pyruvate/2-oxoglutarate/acetoin dehydrogenase E1 component